jgi:serine/threonine protein phosphatase PrpC
VLSKTSFICHIINHQKGTTQLPFSVAGLTQQGVVHMDDNINNQDSIGILTEENFIAGIVCDGCTGTHAELKRSSSNNEVGAKLIAYLSMKILKKILSENVLSSESVISEFTKRIIDSVNSIVNLFCEDEKEKELFIADFLTTTVIGFFVNQNKYVIFHSGDGIIVLNGDIDFLTDDSGSYFVSSLLESNKNKIVKMSVEDGETNEQEIRGKEKYETGQKFKVFAEGETDKLTSLFLATDGFYDFIDNYTELFLNFINIPDRLKLEGFNPHFVREFRKKFVWNKKIKEHIELKNLFNDDASFIFLKRMKDDNA